MRKAATEFTVGRAQQQASCLRIKPANWKQASPFGQQLGDRTSSALIAHGGDDAERFVKDDGDVWLFFFPDDAAVDAYFVS